MRVLFLDCNEDRAEKIRQAAPEMVWVQTAKECIEHLSQEWDVVRLDHDLGGEVFVDSQRSDCGMEVARYLAANKPEHLKETLFIVHAPYERAGIAMTEIIESAGYDAMYRPFSFSE